MGGNVTLVDPEGNYVGGVPSGQSGATSENQELIISGIGSTADPAWNGTDPNASVISLLKAIALNTSTT